MCSADHRMARDSHPLSRLEPYGHICFAAGVAMTALSLLPVAAEAVRHAIERSVTG